MWQQLKLINIVGEGRIQLLATPNLPEGSQV